MKTTILIVLGIIAILVILHYTEVCNFAEIYSLLVELVSG